MQLYGLLWIGTALLYLLVEVLLARGDGRPVDWAVAGPLVVVMPAGAVVGSIIGSRRRARRKARR